MNKQEELFPKRDEVTLPEGQTDKLEPFESVETVGLHNVEYVPEGKPFITNSMYAEMDRKYDKEAEDAIMGGTPTYSYRTPEQYMEQVKRGLVFTKSNDWTLCESIQLQVLGEPTAQKRHRSVRMGKFNRQYDPSAADKGDFLSIVQKHAPETPYAVPLQLDLRFYFTRPKAHYKSGKNAHLLKDSPPEYHTSRPDADNLIKFVMDALNKVYWKDDSYIVSLTVQKMYSENPRTEIELTII